MASVGAWVAIGRVTSDTATGLINAKVTTVIVRAGNAPGRGSPREGRVRPVGPPSKVAFRRERGNHRRVSWTRACLRALTADGPQLVLDAPAEVVRIGKHRDVMEAARAFLDAA